MNYRILFDTATFKLAINNLLGNCYVIAEIQPSVSLIANLFHYYFRKQMTNECST